MRRKSKQTSWIVAGLWFGLCAASILLWQPHKLSAAAHNTPNSSSYTIQPGDILRISVWKEPELHSEELVRPDGRFSFPLAGELVAHGKSVVQIQSEIVKRLAKYIPDLVVTVSVKQILGNKIYVLGEVNNPGEFVANRPIDVLQALSMAGGTTRFAALDEIKVLRRTDGQLRSVRVNYGDIKKGKNLQQNIILVSGDLVLVP